MHRFTNFRQETLQVWSSWFFKFFIGVTVLSFVRLPELRLIELFTIIIPMCACIATVFALVYALKFFLHNKAGILGKLLTKSFL